MEADEGLKGVCLLADFVRDHNDELVAADQRAVSGAVGYKYLNSKKNLQLILLPESTLKSACPGLTPQVVLKKLKEQGFLHTQEPGRMASRFKVGVSKKSFYALKYGLLEFRAHG